MATNPTGSTASLVERVKNILTQPKAEWPRIDAEPTSIADIYKNYVAILAAIGPIAGLIGQQAFGIMGFKPSLQYSLTTAIMSYVMSLIGCYVAALVVNALAPSFGGTKDMVKAFKVVAYSYTAAWVAGIVTIIPMLGLLVLIALIYGLYLLYLGLPVLMRAPQDKAVGYVAVVIVVQILIYFAIGIVVTTLVGAIAGPLMPTSTITYTVPS
jgi:hypothetical protein